ncbi:hypothetical protein ACF9IK_00235 [Kitasatospora hibisci]|uniref:hypothetical protein n=1 Tax=Kitasatospora hibisci TaxID=3369522 RepID=UPI003754F9BA
MAWDSGKGGLLELHTVHFADEVRDPLAEVGNLPEQVTLSTQEIKTAEQLIGMLSIDWRPEDWHDTYEEQVKKLVEDKLAGREIAVSAGPAPEATNVIDLMDALRRSLDSARKPEPAEKTPRSASRKAPAGAARAPRATGGKKSTSAKEPTVSRPAGKKRASATGKQ